MPGGSRILNNSLENLTRICLRTGRLKRGSKKPKVSDNFTMLYQGLEDSLKVGLHNGSVNRSVPRLAGKGSQLQAKAVWYVVDNVLDS